MGSALVAEGVVVQAEAVHQQATAPPSRHAHEGFGPVVVVVGRAAGDLVDRLVAEAAHVGLVAPILIGVELGGHAAAAAPVFIAHAPVAQRPRLITPVAAAQVGHGAEPSKEMYSTHCCISCTVPLPTLPQM